MSKTDWSETKRARVEAAQRSRRIIFNDDTHELALEDANTPEGFLAHRIAPLAETQVGAISWSVLCGQFDAPAYDSKVQPIYGDAQGAPVKYWHRVTENVKTLAREYRCPLHLVCDFAHKHDMEAFASVRMNDVHDSFMDANAMTVWKRTHPEFMVDTHGTLPEFELYTTAQDFSHEPVRQRKLEIIEEICQWYDVDGFELDYIRHPVLFSRRLRGESCTADEIALITSMMREIRSLTDAAAERRGRPSLIAVRVPDTFITSLDNGMDVSAWLEEDLIDLLIIGGGYAPWSLPVETWVEAAQPHGVPVYPCVNMGKESLPLVRGLASNWYCAGADGLYFWNLGTPFEFMTGDELAETRRRCYACVHEVGDANMLIGKEKLFSVDSATSGILPYYAHLSASRPLPLKSKGGALRTGVIGRLPLIIGDDLESHPPTRATLTVEFDDLSWKDALLVRLNGEEVTDSHFVLASEGQTDCQLTHNVRVPLLQTGRNVVEIAARNDIVLPKGIVTILGLDLTFKYA
ncbi:hypothetical protein C6502_13640 [Candidatus Poribacteria bacterium]|nr:MAG: hypothetical protein C6502_13640 [Candidatus Poribacteria bacterium]